MVVLWGIPTIPRRELPVRPQQNFGKTNISYENLGFDPISWILRYKGCRAKKFSIIQFTPENKDIRVSDPEELLEISFEIPSILVVVSVVWFLTSNKHIHANIWRHHFCMWKQEIIETERLVTIITSRYQECELFRFSEIVVHLFVILQLFHLFGLGHVS